MKLPTLKRSHYKDYLLLLLFAILAYWPISLMLLSAKGDAVNYFLAMRYNTSEAIQHGFFPFWTPFINLGYPLHGDMQSGVWNPLVLLLSIIRQYDIYWLHTEMILIILISGVSMYHLLKFLRLERTTVLVISVAYMLNGYMTDAGQFLNWMYAAAYLPFVFLCLIRCFKTFSFKDAFLLGLSQLVMYLSAYPADFILFSYIVVAFAICSFINALGKERLPVILIKYLKVATIALLVFLIIGLPAHLSYAQFIPLIKRGNGIDLQTALMNSLAPANLISFLVPWATMKGNAFAATDPLIRNCYMGILTFIFLLCYLFAGISKSFLHRFLLAIFIIFLIFSLGQFGGLRTISYYLLPLMKTFRHPANAKLFFLFAAQVLAAYPINQYLKGELQKKYLIKRITLSLLLLSIICMILSFFKSNIFQLTTEEISKRTGSLVTFLREFRLQLSFFDLLFLNSVFLFAFLLVMYMLVRKNRLTRFFLPMMCIDLFITAQLMLPLTYTQQNSVSYVQSILKAQPPGYPIPDNRLSLSEFSKGGMDHWDDIGCMNPYNKLPGRSNYIITPSNLKTQDDFWDYPALRDKIMQYPLAYFSDTVFASKDSLLFIADNRKSALSDLPLLPLPHNNTTIQIKRFDPNRFEFETSNPNPGFFVLLQNYYSNWRITINGKQGEITPTNISFMGSRTPAGKNTIVFTYHQPWLPWLGLLSLVLVSSALAFIYIIPKKNIL